MIPKNYSDLGGQQYKKSKNQKIRIYLIIRTNGTGLHKNRIKARWKTRASWYIHCSHVQNEIIHGNFALIQFEKEDLDESKNDQLSQYKRPVFIVNDMESTFINMKRSFDYVGDNSTFQKRITAILVVQWVNLPLSRSSSPSWSILSPSFSKRLYFSVKSLWLKYSLPAHKLSLALSLIQTLSRSGPVQPISCLTFTKFQYLKSSIFTAIIQT